MLALILLRLNLLLSEKLYFECLCSRINEIYEYMKQMKIYLDNAPFSSEQGI